jgi:hypothetical protein
VRQHAEHEQAARRALGDAAFADEFRRGALLSLDDAVAVGVAEDHPPEEDQTRGRDEPTRPELTVLTRFFDVATDFPDAWAEF